VDHGSSVSGSTGFITRWVTAPDSGAIAALGIRDWWRLKVSFASAPCRHHLESGAFILIQCAEVCLNANISRRQ